MFQRPSQWSKTTADAAGLPHGLAPHGLHSNSLAGFSFFLHKKKKMLYEAISPVTEAFGLVGEVESSVSAEGLQAAGAPPDATKQPKPK